MKNDFHSNFPIVPVKKVKRYANELLRLEEAYGRGLRAKEIVDEARAKNSPLHDYFEWDNKAAGEKYRVQQARQLVAVIRVTVIDDKGREAPARAMVSVIENYDGKKNHVFASHPKVLNDPDFRSQRIDTAFNELEQWCRRWGHPYKELAPLRRAILEAVQKERERLLSPV